MSQIDYSRLSNAEVIALLDALVVHSRRDLANLLGLLTEVEVRKLYAELSFPSAFAYCLGRLRFSEPEAYRRMHASRASRRFPVILALIESGELSLTAIAMLTPHLSEDNHRKLLLEAQGKSKQDLEAMLAPLAGKTATRDRIQYVKPAAKIESGLPLLEPTSSIKTAEVVEQTPVVEERLVQFKFTAREGLLKKYERVRELLWHKNPRASCEEVIEAALESYLEAKAPERRAARNQAGRVWRRARKPGVRYIPKHVRMAVWKRDGGKCTFTGPDGTVCGSTAGVEYDHILPWSLGGLSVPENLRLLCFTHNQLEARRKLGATSAARRGRRLL